VGLPDVHRRPRHRLLLGEPFINDLGIPLNELKWGASCDYEWTASDHISDIHDVWKTGWDDDLGTVPPESLARRRIGTTSTPSSAPTDRAALHAAARAVPLAREGQKLKQIQKGIKRQEEEAENGDNDGGGLLSSLSDSVRPKIESRLDDSEFAQKAGCGSNSIPRTS